MQTENTKEKKEKVEGQQAIADCRDAVILFRMLSSPLKKKRRSSNANFRCLLHCSSGLRRTAILLPAAPSTCEAHARLRASRNAASREEGMQGDPEEENIHRRIHTHTTECARAHGICVGSRRDLVPWLQSLVSASPRCTDATCRTGPSSAIARIRSSISE